jgi:ABC-type transport system substrate-binding protein
MSENQRMKATKHILSCLPQTLLVAGLILTSTQAKILNPPSTPKERKKMNAINIGIVGPNKQLDPVLGYLVHDFLVFQCIYQTLVRINTEGNITSDLAQSWEISNDGTVYTFHLNPLAKFSDQSQVKASDVAFSLSRHLWPQSKSIIKNYLSETLDHRSPLLEGQTHPAIKVTSSTTVEIRLKSPYPPFLQVLTMPGFSIVSKSDKLRDLNIGSGHLKARYDNASESWVFTPNPSYLGTKSGPNEIRISSLKDTEDALNSIQEGRNDVILGLPSDTGTGFTPMLPSTYKVHSTDSLSFAHLVFNMKKGNFQNVNTRKALGQYLNHLAKTLSTPSTAFHHQTTFIPKGVLPLTYFEREVSQTSKASLMSTLKAHLGSKTVKIILPVGRFPKDFVATMKEILQGSLPNLQFDELSGAEFRKQRDSGDYDIAYLGYIGNFADPDGFLDCIRENSIPGVHAEAQQLFESINKIRFTTDASVRLHGYVNALRLFEDNWTVIPLYQAHIPIVHHEKIAIPDTHFRYESEIWNFIWQK